MLADTQEVTSKFCFSVRDREKIWEHLINAKLISLKRKLESFRIKGNCTESTRVCFNIFKCRKLITDKMKYYTHIVYNVRKEFKLFSLGIHQRSVKKSARTPKHELIAVTLRWIMLPTSMRSNLLANGRKFLCWKKLPVVNPLALRQLHYISTILPVKHFSKKNTG